MLPLGLSDQTPNGETPNCDRRASQRSVTAISSFRGALIRPRYERAV
jgi:hypothetical protein